jgi:hypothetical protein
LFYELTRQSRLEQRSAELLSFRREMASVRICIRFTPADGQLIIETFSETVLLSRV